MGSFSNFVDSWDVIIVGAGVVGCSAAYRLAQQGLRVLIVEADEVGGRQSGRNLGFIRQQGRDFRELELAMEANRIWSGLEQELGADFGWRKTGNLALAATPEKADRFAAWAKQAGEFGLSTKVLSPAEIRQRVPRLRGAYTCGMFTESDAKADPYPATYAIYEGARRLGAELLTGQRVREIVTANRRAAGVRVAGRFLRASTVICAAGAGSGKLLRRAGITLPQDFVRATVVRLDRRAALSSPGIWGVGTGMRQSADGSVHLSNAGGVYDVRIASPASLRWFMPSLKSGHVELRFNYLHMLERLLPHRADRSLAPLPRSRAHPAPSAYFAQKAVEEFAGMFPDQADTPILGLWAEYIDNTPDLIPAVGPTEKVANLLIGTGFSGHGFGVGPAAGYALADLALGRPQSGSISELSPDRFWNGTWELLPPLL